LFYPSLVASKPPSLLASWEAERPGGLEASELMRLRAREAKVKREKVKVALADTRVSLFPFPFSL
jgi:hypothetical protein